MLMFFKIVFTAIAFIILLYGLFISSNLGKLLTIKLLGLEIEQVFSAFGEQEKPLSKEETEKLFIFTIFNKVNIVNKVEKRKINFLEQTFLNIGGGLIKLLYALILSFAYVFLLGDLNVLVVGVNTFFNITEGFVLEIIPLELYSNPIILYNIDLFKEGITMSMFLAGILLFLTKIIVSFGMIRLVTGIISFLFFAFTTAFVSFIKNKDKKHIESKANAIYSLYSYVEFIVTSCLIVVCFNFLTKF